MLEEKSGVHSQKHALASGRGADVFTALTTSWFSRDFLFRLFITVGKKLA